MNCWIVYHEIELLTLYKVFFIIFKGLSLKYIKTIFFEGESATINLFCIMVFLQGFAACVSVAFVFIFYRCLDT